MLQQKKLFVEGVLTNVTEGLPFQQLHYSQLINYSIVIIILTYTI